MFYLTEKYPRKIGTLLTFEAWVTRLKDHTPRHNLNNTLYCSSGCTRVGVPVKLSKYCKISKQEHSLQLLVVFLPGSSQRPQRRHHNRGRSGVFLGAQIYSFLNGIRQRIGHYLPILRTALETFVGTSRLVLYQCNGQNSICVKFNIVASNKSLL